MFARGFDGFLVPRADAHQGEYVTAADMRLSWLTGFTGSAGFCIALQNTAGLFVDSRYTLQAQDQADTDFFTPVKWPATKPAAWLKEQLPNGGVVAYDPWLHTKNEIAEVKTGLDGTELSLRETDNLIDSIWHDRPAPPSDLMVTYPSELAGQSSSEKRGIIGEVLKDAGQTSAVLTQPDSIAWLLNTRGTDLGQTPVALAFALVHDTGRVTLFIDPAKVDSTLRTHLGNEVEIESPDAFNSALQALQGTVRVDGATAPLAVSNLLSNARAEVVYAPDPVSLPKACKNAAEIAGTREAHIRDGAAVCEFLAWLDTQGAAPDLSEIEVVKKLESLRQETGELRNISFDTICGSGPNGAIVHYRVNEDSNRRIKTGDVLLVDSGAQYLDGTTDITRTIAIGAVSDESRRAFTLVLKGMIALSRQRFPKGISGRDLDVLARAALWQDGRDYGHGTGHGVGVYLSVHEGPQRISRMSDEPLQTGMILSNEPGFYREGAFGIRIENLVVVQPAKPLPNSTVSEMFEFETLTWAPIDRNMIVPELLGDEDRIWLDQYHAEVLDKIGPDCSPNTQKWLKKTCARL